MQTFREVLGRQEERQNLRNVGLCILLVLALMFISFGVAYMHVFPHARQTENRVNPLTRVPTAYP
jgi:hypothetical protein